MSLVSVIIPVYNASKYLNECIESVCSQTVEDIEILLINDGSTDDSETICKSWEVKDKRIYYYFQANRGVSAARNLGIQMAKSEFITFVDSDDIISRDYCKKMLEAMDSQTDMVVLGMARLYKNQIVPIRHRLVAGNYQPDHLKKIIIDDGTMSGFTFHSACSTLYRRSVIINNNILFDENIKFNEDGLFNVIYVMNCSGNICVDFDCVIYYYRVNESSSSNTVNLVSGSFLDSLNSIENILINLSKLGKNDIADQISKRAVTNGLSQLRYASKHLCDISVIRKIINSDNFQKGIKLINIWELPLKKKTVLLLLKTKNARLIRIGLRVT